MNFNSHPWAADLAQMHEQVWLRLSRGALDRRAPARHPALATVAPDGRPRVRTVVLRRVDAAGATLDIHTDLHSAKVSDLRSSPLAELHAWDSSAHLQTRLEAVVDILTGADVAAMWARVPEPSRKSYGGNPYPGDPIPGALEYTKNPDQATFVVLRLRVSAIDVLHLGPEHRRARFQSSDQWAGQWLTP